MCKSYRAAYHTHGLPGFLRVLLPTPNYRLNLYQPLDAFLWMDHTKPEHPSPSFIYFNGGRSYFSGIWDHEFYECSETRTHMIPPENRERE